MELTPKKTPSWVYMTNRFRDKLIAWLIAPTVRIKDPAQRRSSRLLSFFLICLFLLFLGVNFSYYLTVPEYKFPPADLIGYGLLVVTYILSRTRWTGLAVFVLLFMFPMNVFQNILSGTSVVMVVTLTYLLPSYILASIFLPTIWMAFFGYGINLVILLLPLLAPERVHNLMDIIGPLAVGVISVTLLIIAMEHRNQIEKDRRSEMRKAYDSTLAGWSRALEIRDKETDGHSHRVTMLTQQLAQACGLRGQDLEYIYRGALLHDIGKMAIPDSILLKPGKLTDDEWEVMRTHPRIACDMLSSIEFLQPAMIIPAYHHEWWNGQGYPAGLQGEQIPLPARIFAVVDVWDALLSDRPYRQAWTREQALSYISDQRGQQFDPMIVDRFLGLDL